MSEEKVAAAQPIYAPLKPTVDESGNPISPRSRLVAAILAWVLGASREDGYALTSNKGFPVKTIRLGAVAVLLIGLTGLTAPAHAAQSLDTSKRNAVAEIVIQAFEKSLASDPEGFEDMCRSYVINPNKVRNRFMGEKDIKGAVQLLGATKKDFRAGVKIALKKACYGYKSWDGSIE